MAEDVDDEQGTLIDRVRRLAAELVVWTRDDVRDALGAKAASSLASLVQRGEVYSPGRKVFALPGIRDEDPRVVDALRRAGSVLHPIEKRIAQGAPIERRERIRIAERAAKEAPSEALLAHVRERLVVTVPEIRDAFGSVGAGRLAEMARQGRLNRIASGIYSVPEIEPGSDEACAAVARLAMQEASAVAEIDAAIADDPGTYTPPAGPSGPPEHARTAILTYWEAGSSKDPQHAGRPPMRRVYIEIPGYPSFFGQRSSKKLDGRSGTIAWGSASPKLGPVGARMLARKTFDPVPDFFWDLEHMVPGHQPTERRLAVRADVHSDLDVADDPAPTSVEEMHMLPCAYVRSDTASLDPARLQHPLPEPVTLLVDHREPPAIITALRRVKNLQVMRTELAVGDYQVEGRLVFERKSNDDFHASLADKGAHLMRQAEAMAATGLHRVLIIEGGAYARRQFVLNRLASTLSYLQNVHGIHVTPTMNQRHSVYAIVQAVKHHLFGMSTEIVQPDPIDKREAAVDPTRLARLLLRHFQGVSEERANALAAHFGTLAAIAVASEEQLREVKGIGRNTAAGIHAAFHGLLK
jgi:Fanconi anemia group M protein